MGFLYTIGLAQSKTQVPAEIASAPMHEDPVARHVHWSAGDDYIASFNSNGSHRTVLLPASERIIGSAKTIKYSRQLPAAVKAALDNSVYPQWYVQCIVRIDSADQKGFYGITLNNGNLPDGDHYHSFLEQHTLYISDNGVFLLPAIRLRPLVFH